jgi:hypothetical protein
MQHLPIHPLTGIQAIYVDKHGTPRYPIMGASEDGDAGDSGGDSGDAGDTGGDDGDDKEGNDATDASNRMLIDERNGRKSAETLLAELTGKSKSEIRRLLKDPDKARDALKPARKGDDKGDKSEVDADAIRAEAQREADAKANARIVRSEVRALAAETFANPADALHNLNLDDYEVNEDGELEDAAAVKAALADVLKKNPHYAKKGKAPKPDPSQGPRGEGKPDPGKGTARLRAAYADLSK